MKIFLCMQLLACIVRVQQLLLAIILFGDIYEKL